MGSVLGHPDQLAGVIDAIGVVGVVEILADTLGVVTLEHPHDLRVGAEKVAFLAILDTRQQFHRLGSDRHVARGRRIVERLDRGDRQGDVILQGHLGLRQQTLTGFLHLILGLILQDPNHGQTDHQGAEQYRQYREGHDFGLQAQTHNGSLL